MSKSNLQPIYAENNPNWRIRYHHNGMWELQEYSKLPDGVDKRKEQPWITHNTSMSHEDAIMALAPYNIMK